jgi:hypothetical protein
MNAHTKFVKSENGKISRIRRLHRLYRLNETHRRFGCGSALLSVSRFGMILTSSNYPATGSAVIRFNCPNCSRAYELPNAMAHLPLVCKGCGQPLAVPEPTPDPPKPEPRPELPRPKVEPPKAVTSSPPVELPRPAKPEPEPILARIVEPADPMPDGDTLFEKPDPLAELEAQTPPPPTVKPAVEKKPAPITQPRPGGSKLIAIVVDAGVALTLLIAGVLLGEMLVKKPTATVLREVGSAA